MKNKFLLMLLLSFNFVNAQISISNSMAGKYDVLTSYITGSTNSIKIITAIPSGNENLTTVYIKGYNYGLPRTMNIQISWYANGVGAFSNATASSAGGSRPEIYLTNENNVIVIYLKQFISYGRLEVSALATGLGENPSWYTLWSVADAAVSNTNNPVYYFNDFGSLFAETVSSPKVDASNLTAGNAIVSGKLGIGTSNPSYKFTVDDYTSDGIAGRFAQNATTGSPYAIHATALGASSQNIGGYFKAGNAAYNYGVFSEVTDATNNYNFYAGSIAKSYFAGRVGIGTLSPQSMLHVVDAGTESQPSTLRVSGKNYYSAGDAQIILSQGFTGEDLKIQIAGTDSRSDGLIANDAYIFSGQALNITNRGNGTLFNNKISLGVSSTLANYSDITFSTAAQNTNAVERMRITHDGRVLIGTTDVDKAKAYSLAVNGSALFTKAVVKVYGNWPDYVFKPNYKLRSLEQLEQFIKVNNHLPDVPSEKQVKADGVDVGNNQGVLLKKIEELTLYIIQQQKEINLLKKQVKDIRKK